MTRDVGRLRAAMATLLVASALLFAVGIFIERGTSSTNAPHVEATSPPSASIVPHVEGSGEEGSGEADGEAGEAGASEATTAEAVGDSETGGSEDILGIDPEAPTLVGLALIVSFVAAFLVWRYRRRLIIAGAIVVALIFAALDTLEVSHQAREGAVVLVAIATVVAVGHLLAVGLGVAILRRSGAE
jgi:hypothetical protein